MYHFKRNAVEKWANYFLLGVKPSHYGEWSVVPNYYTSFGLPSELCCNSIILKKFLNSSSNQVVGDDIYSAAQFINANVLQGIIVSPTIILLHINDLISSTSNSNPSFADDNILHSSYSSRKPISAAEAASSWFALANSSVLSAMPKWCDEKLVDCNEDETQSCILTRKNCFHCYVWYNSNPIFRILFSRSHFLKKSELVYSCF